MPSSRKLNTNFYQPTNCCFIYYFDKFFKKKLAYISTTLLSAFYGGRLFFTGFTTARHWILYWACWIQNKGLRTSSLRWVLILSFRLVISISSVPYLQLLRLNYLSPRLCFVSIPSDLPNLLNQQCSAKGTITEILIMKLSSVSRHFLWLVSKHSSEINCSLII
jgi:hypothetical protein